MKNFGTKSINMDLCYDDIESNSFLLFMFFVKDSRQLRSLNTNPNTVINDLAGLKTLTKR